MIKFFQFIVKKILSINYTIHALKHILAKKKYGYAAFVI